MANAEGADGSVAPPMRPIQVKLVLLGEAAVGKSSMVLRFVSNDFQDTTTPTIGAAFLTQKCRLEDKVIKFEIWDTAGQERFHSLAPMYYRNAAAAVVVYDITNYASLEKAKSWVKELQRQASPNIVIAFVGNKLDLAKEPSSNGDDSSATISPPLADEEADDATATPDALTGSSSSDCKRHVAREEAQAYAAEAGLLFFETSAKSGEHVVEVFTEIAKKIPLDQILTARGGAGGAAASGRGGAGLSALAGGRGEGVRLGEDGAQTREGCSC